MRPDRRRRPPTPEPRADRDIDTVVPFEPIHDDAEAVELAAIGGALAAAGAVARDRTPAPDPAFAGGLRGRLLATYGPIAVAGPAGAVPATAVPAYAVGSHTAAPSTGTTAPRAVRPHTAWRLGSWLPSARGLAVGLAAALVVALVAGATAWLVPGPIDATTAAATAATIVRDGEALPLAAGTTLRAGDTIRTAVDGWATLAIGDGETRLGPGTTVVIATLGRAEVVIDQVAGRVWHRVAVPAGATYRVRTDPVTLTAVGTAFDVTRSVAGTADVVRVAAIEHVVRIAGAGLAATLDEGRAATIRSGEGGPDVATGPLGPADLDDPWIRANVARDVALGFDPGVVTALEPAPSPSPSPSSRPEPTAASPSPIASPTALPSASADPSPATTPSPSPEPTSEPSPTPRPTSTPKPSPTPTPKPSPTPAPSLGSLTLAATSCHGGVVLDWSTWAGADFHHYTAVRATSEFATPLAYPPPKPVVALDGTFTKERTATDAPDTGGEAGVKYWYRALAFSADDRVIAASPLRTAVAKPIKALGDPVTSVAGGSIQIDWTPYGGPAACFSYYKVVWSSSSTTPSYLGDHDGAVPYETQASATATIDGFASGSWYVRVQAIRVTALGKFVVAQTGVATVDVP
jgi:ferric-dicitrate binding protein FerR (iron transport regulator)